MKTVILYCNGDWKYIVGLINRVKSSGIWVYRLGPDKHKNAECAAILSNTQ